MHTHSDASIRVRPVLTSRDKRRFLDFPYTLYRSSPCWVPPLRRDQADALFGRNHPFFRHSRIVPFLAEDAAGRMLGRIAAIVNGMHLQRYGDGAGFFGFFECVEREDVAAALFDAAATSLRAEELTAMRGPANPSINDSSGLLVGGFDRTPSLLMPYNPPYYEELLVRHGFERVMTMWAYYGAAKHLDIRRLRRGVELARKRLPGLSIRTPDMKRFIEEALLMRRIYNEAFEGGWGHVPLTEDEFLYMARSMRPILDPGIVFFLEHDGEPIGFSLSLPDINPLLRHLPDGRLFPFGFLELLARQRFGKPREFRNLVLAILPEYQRRGLDQLLILSSIEEGSRHGYLAAELSWVMDDNVVLKNGLERIGAVVDKEYAMFEKQLSDSSAPA
ncbi:MAG TPA: hypothetical protein VEK57_10955 [Thermoanaerobaculia bacterium]|nr:hypothetical protein [Thermoanaerobaculia bacterium]